MLHNSSSYGQCRKIARAAKVLALYKNGLTTPRLYHDHKNIVCAEELVKYRSFSSKIKSSRPTPAPRSFARVLQDTLFGCVELIPQIPRAWKVFRYGPTAPPPSTETQKSRLKNLQPYKATAPTSRRTLPTVCRLQLVFERL